MWRANNFYREAVWRLANVEEFMTQISPQAYHEAVEEISLGSESVGCSLTPGTGVFNSVRPPKECRRDTVSCWRKQGLNTMRDFLGDELLHPFRVRKT